MTTTATKLKGAELDYWVARAVGYRVERHPSEPGWYLVRVPGFDSWLTIQPDPDCIRGRDWSPSTEWQYCGPLIHEFKIALMTVQATGNLLKWAAFKHQAPALTADLRTIELSAPPLVEYGSTAPKAAMRLLVASVYPKVLGVPLEI